MLLSNTTKGTTDKLNNMDKSQIMGSVQEPRNKRMHIDIPLYKFGNRQN